MGQINKTESNEECMSGYEGSATVLPSIKKNSLYNVLKTFSSVIFPLITFPYISRVLGVENIGKINFGNNIVSYFSLIATLGITVYAVRECSKVTHNPDELGKTASQIFSINIITTGASYIALFICLVSVSKLRSYQLLIIIQSVSLLLTALGADWLNTSMEDFRYITIRKLAFQLVSLIAMLVFVHQREHYIVYVIISVFSSGGVNILNIFYRRKYCKVQFTFKINWKRHLPPIISLFTMLIAQNILGQLDITMLGFLKEDQDVGLYSTSVKIINIFFQVIGSIVWVVMPRLSSLFEREDYESASRIIQDVVRFSVTVGLPCVVGILFVAPEVLLVFGGSEYILAENCLRLLSLNMLFGYVGNIYGLLFLIPSGREKWLTLSSCIGALFNGFTNAVLIPVWGIEGAALTTLLSSMFSLPILIYAKEKAPEKVNFGIDKGELGSPVLGCFFIALICSIGRMCLSNDVARLVIVVLLSTIVYVAVLLFTKNKLFLNVWTLLIVSIKSIGKK